MSYNRYYDFGIDSDLMDYIRKTAQENERRRRKESKEEKLYNFTDFKGKVLVKPTASSIWIDITNGDIEKHVKNNYSVLILPYREKGNFEKYINYLCTGTKS